MASEKVYVLRAYFPGFLDGSNAYIYGVFHSLAEAKAAAKDESAFFDGVASGEWTEEWSDWEDTRKVLIHSSRIKGLDQSYHLIEEHAFGVVIKDDFAERVRLERLTEEDFRRSQEAEYARREARYERWRSMSADEKEAIKTRYLTTSISQKALATECDIPLTDMQRFLKGLKPRPHRKET